MKDFKIEYFCDIFLLHKQVFPFMVSVRLQYKPYGVEYYWLTLSILDDN